MSRLQYFAMPSAASIKDAEMRSVLTPLIENIRLLTGADVFVTDERRSVRKQELSQVQIGLQEAIRQMRGSIEEINTRISGFGLTRQAVELLEQRRLQLQADIAGLQSDVNQISQTDIAGINTELNSLDSTISSLSSSVGTLTSTVGNNSSGLVKSVNDLNTTVGNNSSGLVKSVNDLNTTVGNNSSGLVKKVNDLDDQINATGGIEERVQALESA